MVKWTILHVRNAFLLVGVGWGMSTKGDGLGHDINLGNSNKYVLLVWLSELYVLEDGLTFFTQLL